jgi:hypothetical protein
MADMLQAGALWLAEQQRAHVSREVVYSRGEEATVSVLATKGTSRYEVTDESGSRGTISSVDFIIMRDDLDFGDGAVEPAPGDRITDDSMIYEVMAIPGEPVARDTDQHRYQLRIHTKYIGPA